MKRYMSFLFAGFLGLFFMSCEGPAGPAGIDGTDGTDGTDGVAGTVTCLQCHSTDNKFAKELEFAQSVHSAGQIAVDYAGGRSSCARCHSGEGFVEFAETGTVGENISAPSAWECKTCHNIHQTFESTDYALRLADPVTLIAGGDVDFGSSNLCVNCHQTRTKEPNTATPGATFTITSTHYGPHYGPQANLLNGVGFAEIAGTYSYPADGSAKHAEDGGRCVGCHMAEYADGTGGHTWNPSLNGCNTAACHDGGLADFDHNNVQTATEALLVDIRDLLISYNVVEAYSEGEYVWDEATNTHVYVEEAAGYHAIAGTYPMLYAQSYFNWIGITEDRSMGVHNPVYIEALLENTKAALIANPPTP